MYPLREIRIHIKPLFASADDSLMEPNFLFFQNHSVILFHPTTSVDTYHHSSLLHVALRVFSALKFESWRVQACWPQRWDGPIIYLHIYLCR